MRKLALAMMVAVCQFSFAHASSSAYSPSQMQPPSFPMSALEVTFDSFASGLDYDAISSIKALLEEGPETVYSKIEWRAESSSTQVQLCVMFVRPEFMQSFKSQFQQVLETRDERTSVTERSSCD